MTNIQSNIKKSQLIRLWRHLSSRRQKQFLLLLALMVIVSLLEIVSLGAVIPFLGVLSSPDQVYQHSYMKPFIEIFELTEPGQLILPLTIFFITVVLIAGTFRLILLYAMTKLSFSAGADISISIYRRTLYQEYSVHVARNSSQVINGIITKTSTVINGVLAPLLIFISSVILLLGIMIALFIINVQVALISFIGFGLLYWSVIRFTRNRLKENSENIAEKSTLMMQSLQEGLGGIRDVLIDGSQQFYSQLYRNADLPFRRASGNNAFINKSPRYAMEAIGMTLIAGLAYAMSQQEGGLINAIPVLGALALGAQRLLPALQQTYHAYSSIKGNKFSFDDVLQLLDQPLPDYVNQSFITPIPYENKLELKNISFRYQEDTPWILKNINLTIEKGECIGFIGETGSGKSTLLDIVMGLLDATDGALIVDKETINKKNKRSWQLHISHVPQNIYLSDATIEENIAFGIPKDMIDLKQVKKVAQKAQISNLIEDWKDGYQTFVGERGIRLSGGQRQRIGIARALYKESDVLIFDEATSSLDNDTERDVMKAIEGLGKELTILIIAHRLTTLKGCDKIIRIDKNNKLQILGYAEL